MDITYTNKLGTVRMSGHGRKNAWRIIEISGIGFPKKTFKYNTFAGIYGQELASVEINSRTITIKGEIPKDSQDAQSMANVMRILNTDGELRIQTGKKIRKAKARISDFQPEQRKSIFKTFTLQLVMDNPFFFGDSPVSVSVYKRVPLLASSFTFPMEFSRRVMSAAIVNSGDVPAEPIITIKKIESSKTESYNSIALTLALGTEYTSTVTLNHTIIAGETVVLDIPNRKVTSNISGNIIGSISEDTVLSDFVIPPGVGMVSVDTVDTGLSVVCEFNNQYVEASHDE